MDPVQDAWDVSEHAANAAAWKPHAQVPQLGPESGIEFEPSYELAAQEKAAQADLLRDIDGNPFRTVTVDPSLLTPTVLNLARAAYDDRLLPGGELDNARLAVLADALEEAGCSDGEVLGHLRGPGPHVRGCWVVDLISGRE
jgi:hypothetical protein